MKPIDVSSWEEFEKELKELISQGRSQRKPHERGYRYPLLYRGQRIKQLETSLEKHGKRKMSFDEYFSLIKRVQPEIETITKTHWKDVPTIGGFLKWLEKPTNPMFVAPPGYAFLAHLRHLGFPSPLLDWSRSPYVAAYFAFARAAEKEGEEVSIYLHWELPLALKGNLPSPTSSHIISLGPYIRAHRRHVLQQSDYTVCVVQEDEKWKFASHGDVPTPNETEQEFLWKFNIPSVERMKVLHLLDTYNLNGFSLFESEESLMETMALRELDFRDRNL